MKKLVGAAIKLGLIAVIISSCSNNDDNKQICLETSATMKINGELQSFQASGRGIHSRQNGYELQVFLDRRNNNPYREQAITIILPYKQTGENIIEQFIYHQYIDNISFDGDFLDGDFQSNVITNTRTCFYSTFSGSLSNGNQEVILTDGVFSYEYEDPFDE